MNKEELVAQNKKLLEQEGKLLDIIVYPNNILKRFSNPVKNITPEVLQLIRDMFATMKAKKGVGMAAVQVGVLSRLFVADCHSNNQGNNQDEPLVFINPVILKKSKIQECNEGCLSLPGVFQDVPRAQTVQIKALGIDGKSFTLTAKDLLAQCIQHEVEHLNGEIFVEKYKVKTLKKTE